MQGGEIRLEALEKRFGETVAVDSIDLDMPPGEFFTMVGPSGCGKTTTLRMIAGFERPTAGRILLDGVDVAHVPPHKRSVNTVFQSYALFPHLDVAANVAFGLKYQRVTKDERRRAWPRRSTWCSSAATRSAGPTSSRAASSSASRSRGRSILRPRVLLLDEPLGALDARLRKDLQVELKTLQAELGVTFVFVTHDQEEALTMSDRIAVMHGGRVEQAGPPQALYEEPESLFVADFLGSSNLISAEAEGRDGACCRLRIGDVRAAGGRRRPRRERPREGGHPAGARAARAARRHGRQLPAGHGGARRSSSAAPARRASACWAAT